MKRLKDNKIEEKKAAPPDLSNWFERALAVKKLGGVVKVSAALGTSPATVSKWTRKPGTAGAGEPSDFHAELFRRLVEGEEIPSVN